MIFSETWGLKLLKLLQLNKVTEQRKIVVVYFRIKTREPEGSRVRATTWGDQGVSPAR
jgi:hypothetical protein